MCIGDQTHGLHAKPQSRSEGQISVTEDILLVFVALLAEASVVFPVDAQVPCYQLGHQLRRIELLFLQLRRIELCALDNRRLHSSSVPSASNVSRFIVPCFFLPRSQLMHRRPRALCVRGEQGS